MRFKALFLFALGSLGVAAADEAPVSVRLEAEAGAVKVFLHTYRVGDGGTAFDFVANGGQEILYPFQRLTATLTLGDRHDVRFLYQPLELATATVAREAFTIDNVAFAQGEAVDIVYGFPFYRLTYLYDLLPGEARLSVGGALQLRNASIRFTSADGSKRAVSQNLGPVPAIALAGELPLGDYLFAGFEATGLYASSAIINGAGFEFEGSILDASLRIGARLSQAATAFLNLRFLGGSAAGVSQYPSEFWTQSTEKSTANYLATGALTLGATLEL